MPIRPSLRYVNSEKYRADLANGDICLAHGYVGDLVQSRARAKEAKKPQNIGISIPKEGAIVNIDMMAIPADARHPDYAYRFINFVMRPENMAAISNATGYPTASAKARLQVLARLRDNPDIYLDEATYARLIPGKDIPQADMRARMRVWTRFKTAQD